jgi:hypothetical protein
MMRKKLSVEVSNEEGSFLRVWQEVCGVLKNVAIDDTGSLSILHFDSGQKIFVPVDSNIDFSKMINKRICIIHTDQKRRQYLITGEC